MWVKILLGLVALVVIIVAVASFQPTDFTLTRSTTIAAPPAQVFPHLNDFHLWEAWSPWAKLDPSMQKSFGGPASGVGATYGWTGNSKVGEGKMTIIKSQPFEVVGMQLDFKRPMEASNLAEFTLKPEGTGTHVTWTMTGQNSLVAKVFGLFFNMDKLLGADFDKGLAQLKAIAEASPPPK